MATFADYLDEVATESKPKAPAGNQFETQLNQAKEAYRQKYGKDLPVTSGTRTREQQQDLYNRWKAGEKGIYMPLNPADYPNKKTFHENAADISTSVPEEFLNQFGIHRPLGKKDPVHAVLMPEKKTAADKTQQQAPKAEEPTTFGDFIDVFAKEEQKQAAEPSKVKQVADKKFKQPTTAEKLIGLGELALTGITGTVAPIVGGATGVIENIFGGTLGTKEGLKKAEQTAGEVSKALTYEPKTEAGKAVTSRALSAAQQAFEASKLPPVVPEVLPIVGERPVSPGAVEKATEAVRAVVPEAVQRGVSRATEAVRPGMASVGAAATPNEAIISQALQVVSPELRAELKNIPANKVNVPTLQRHIEADTLPVPVRLTEGQATGDPVKLSREQNRRGQDPILAQRFNEQNGQLVENLNAFKDRAAPDVYGARTMDHGQGLIDAYKALDDKLNVNINAKYQALRDAAGGQFPVDAQALLNNIRTSLKKQLLSNDAPPSQLKELKRLASEKAMTFEDYLSLRRNLGQIARTSTDGNVRTAAGIMIKELEKLPLQEGAKKLKPLADEARNAAKNRFQMLERDPAYRAAIDDAVPAEKFIDKFVINGHNKNVQTMLNHLDETSRQHMAAGTLNYLRDRAGIIDNQGNFSQAGYNKALKFLDDSNKLPIIFDGETATGLKTLGNVARYTQAQPRGAFVNNSNTLVGALAERGKALVGKTAETGLNLTVPGLQLGTAVMEARARRAATKEAEKALRPGAGIKND